MNEKSKVKKGDERKTSPGERTTNPRDTLPMHPKPGEAGEGNIEADRNYREGVAQTIATKDVEKLGKEAKRALEGPEAAELRNAERLAKGGPLKI